MTTTCIGTRTATSEGGAYKNVKTDGFTLDDFEATNIGVGLVSIKKNPGVVKNLTISNGRITNVGRVIAMPYDGAELEGFVLRNLVVTEADMFARFKKARHGLIEDVVVTGSKVPMEDFPSGCMTSDLATSNITYRRVTMNGFRQIPVAGKYWNGDGFADEENSTDMVYEDCLACDNADAGLDSKSKGVVVRRFIAQRNGRNLRLWGSGLVEDFRSEDPRKAHIWIGGGERLGEYTIVRPVFVGGSDKPHIQIDAGTEAARITIVDPVVPEGEQLRIVKKDTGKLVQVQVVVTSPPEPEPEPPTPEPEPPTPEPLRTFAVTVQVSGVVYTGHLTEVRP